MVCLLFALFLQERADKAENTICGEKRTCDDDQDIETVTESKHQTDDDGQNGENDVEHVFATRFEEVDQRDNALECNQYAEYDEDDLGCRPAEYQNSDTDNQADCAARPVGSEDVNDTGDHEKRAHNGHTPVECFGTEHDQKDTDHDVKQRRNQFRTGFSFHNKKLLS